MLQFIDYISSIDPPSEHSINMYAVKPHCKHNLSVYIEQMLEVKPTILLMGEAPGFHGCGITGIPFTDERTLSSHPFFVGRGYEYSEKPEHEKTAGIVWSTMIDKVPLMWNIYPFHPFGIHERTNRKPNRDEIILGREIAEQFISLFPIQKIYAVGRAAQSFRPNLEYVRHPSYGGQAIFKEQINKILNP